VGDHHQVIFRNWPGGHEGATVAVLPADEAAGLSQCHGAELRTQPHGQGRTKVLAARTTRPCDTTGNDARLARGMCPEWPRERQ
jgi:hypothetical protein